ncbi:MAG: PVC-type heme-binding CxxCH protein [Verrucomicrobiota bacterium]
MQILPTSRWICATALTLSTVALTAHAAPKPIRVLYFDVTGAEQSKIGTLHRAMQDHGRDAIFFDYFTPKDGLTGEMAGLYDVAIVSGDSTEVVALAALKKSNRVLAVAESDSAETLKANIVKTISTQTKQDWEAFLSQREPEKREPNEYVANYEKRPEAVTFQHPYTAKGSMERIQVPADMHLELFADAPDIGKPIAMAWDARGRCWVATTTDYPHGINPDSIGNDKIIICEDTNGDGKADKFTVFADKLNLPTGLCFVNGGIMVAQPPNFLFLKDTNGDDKADVRETVFGGMWGIADTHAQASNLHYGYDNWLYGAVGYSGFKGNVGSDFVNFSQGTYRFQADGSKLEFLHQFTNNTWGHSYNDAGDQFGGTANNGPIFFGGIPASVFPKGVRGMSAKKINVVPEAHAITPNYRQVDVFKGYTAACGSSFVYSANLPARFQGKALVCEPTMKLVSLMDVQPDGAGYKALDSMNVFASSDEWTSPVYAEVGPDGAIWVADFQNFIIQHNPTPSIERGGFKGTTGAGGAHENPLRDHSRGRIYRVVWNQAKPAKVRPLENAPVSELVTALNSDTQYWRLTAQRLLVEGKKTEASPSLQKLVTANDGTVGAIHALWSLHGLKQLDEPTHKAALSAKDARLRRNAIRALGNDDTSRSLYFGAGLMSDSDAQTRLTALTKLAEFPTSPEIQAAIKGLVSDASNRSDEWLKEAARVLVRLHQVKMYQEGPNLLPNPSFETVASETLPEGWLRRDYGKNPNDIRWESVQGAGKTHSGERAVRVISKERADTSLHADVTIKAKTQYKLSGWVKGKGVRGAVSLNDNVRRIETDRVSRDSDWTEIEATFDSGDKTTASINLLFVGTGEAFFDDVKLTEITPVEEEKVTAGDAKRGEQIFWKHPTAACVLCHALKGQGSTVGPALDGIASRKDAAYIKQSLLEPNAVLAQGFEYLKISPMPPMGLLLKPQELEDIQAFLQTLK